MTTVSKPWGDRWELPWTAQRCSNTKQARSSLKTYIYCFSKALSTDTTVHQTTNKELGKGIEQCCFLPYKSLFYFCQHNLQCAGFLQDQIFDQFMKGMIWCACLREQGHWISWPWSLFQHLVPVRKALNHPFPLAENKIRIYHSPPAATNKMFCSLWHHLKK